MVVAGTVPAQMQFVRPWAAQLPYKALGPIREKIGGFAEVVVFDRPTQSLLVTDLVCSVAEEPPAII